MLNHWDKLFLYVLHNTSILLLSVFSWKRNWINVIHLELINGFALCYFSRDKFLRVCLSTKFSVERINEFISFFFRQQFYGAYRRKNNRCVLVLGFGENERRREKEEKKKIEKERRKKKTPNQIFALVCANFNHFTKFRGRSWTLKVLREKIYWLCRNQRDFPSCRATYFRSFNFFVSFPFFSFFDFSPRRWMKVGYWANRWWGEKKQ